MRKYAVLALVPLVFILDRVTKVLVVEHLGNLESVHIAPFFSLVHVRNYGGAFSLLNDHQYAHYIFIILPILIAAALVFVIFRFAFPPAKMLALSLILSGALGNIYDRISYGNVVDFLDFYYGSLHWPAFNVADMAVSIGIGIWFFAELFQGKKKETT